MGPADLRMYPPAMTQNPMELAASAVPAVPDGGGLVAGLQLVLGRVASAQERVAAALDEAAARRAVLPVAIPLAQVGVVPNPAGSFVVDLGGPQPGRQWTLRRWAIADGGDLTSAIAGTPTADLFVGKPSGNRGFLTQWAGRLTGLPAVALYSNEQVPVYATDHLFCIINGATTVGQQIAVGVFILDEPVASFTSTIEV